MLYPLLSYLGMYYFCGPRKRELSWEDAHSYWYRYQLVFVFTCLGRWNCFTQHAEHRTMSLRRFCHRLSDVQAAVELMAGYLPFEESNLMALCEKGRGFCFLPGVSNLSTLLTVQRITLNLPSFNYQWFVALVICCICKYLVKKGNVIIDKRKKRAI